MAIGPEVLLAVSRTEEILANYSSTNDLTTAILAYKDVERDLGTEGYSLREFAPTLADTDQFSFDWFRRFFDAYAQRVRASLCTEKGELRGSVTKAMSSGSAALLVTLGGALSIPLGAIVVLAPIAAVLLHSGIDAFCEMSLD
jgi:hypothetical protein